jgi:hypothetical protein
MWVGGGFAMKNAVRQSTKNAIDSIISDFINDIDLQSFQNIKPPVLHASNGEKNDRLLVMPLKAQLGIKNEEAILLTDLLSVEIHRSGMFTILNRDNMKAVLDKKEFELAMGCDDNICLLKNVEKLAV